MKLITYSLFGINNFNAKNIFEFRSYIRGFYWNCRMNNLIYPDWITHLEIDRETYLHYQNLFDWLKENNNLSINIVEQDDARCKSMLWRMKPVFYEHVTHVMCRDSDSITTYREAQCTQLWLESCLAAHAINDNSAHGGLMGGMVSFETAKFKALTGFQNWQEMVGSVDYSQHGTDQDFLNRIILPKIQNSLYAHCLNGYGIPLANTFKKEIQEIQLPQVEKKLWESDLTCRHIGSAGVVEMELLRFFERFDEYNWKYKAIEIHYKEIFYWQIN